MKTIYAAIGMLLISSSSWATIDSFQRVAIPRISNLQDPADFNYSSFNTQTNFMKKFCLEKALTWDPVSTAAVYRLDGVGNPYNIPVLGPGNLTVDINLVSRPDVNFIYTYASIDNYVQSGSQYVHSPSLTIDVSAMPSSTADERLEALTHAKLAILAITETLYAPYRATISVTGLPSQVGISRPGFTAVNATTNWPYSATSPILASYKNELLDSNCR